MINCPRRFLVAAITPMACFALLVTAPAAQAATITWNVAQNVTGDTNVSLNGTSVGAVNLDGPAATVNGVNFQPLDIGSGSATVGSFTVNGFFFNQFNPSFSTGSAATPFASLGAGYQSLLSTAAAVGGTMTLSIEGLTVGQSYEFQAWVNDSRNQIPPGFTFSVDVAAGNMVTLDPNPSLGDGGLGQYAIGTFVADTASQIITFTNDEVAVINAFQLRQLGTTTPISVPEPATATLGLLSVAALMLRRRRMA